MISLAKAIDVMGKPAERPPTLMNRAQFARLMERAYPTIISWIKKGRISADAIIDGKIWVERAKEELAIGLDTRKQNITGGNPTPIQLEGTTVNVLTRRRTAEADLAELRAEEKRRQMALDEGRWMEVVAAQKIWGRDLAQLTQSWELFQFNTQAKDVAEEFNLAWRLVAAKMRESYRKFQAELSEKYAMMAAGSDADGARP
jgi:hypothetical protein